MILSVFGRLPSGKRKLAIQQSKNYSNGAFRNQSKTVMMAPNTSFKKLIKAYYNKPKLAQPNQPIPQITTNLHQLDTEQPIIIWFGHSSYFIKLNSITFLIDPVFSGSASPFSFMVKAYEGSNQYSVEDFPQIDYLILTHDHYDHLDYKTIIALRQKVKHVCCTLGVAAHLEHWGYEASQLTEFDWWQSKTLENDITITAAPGRHFSGRGLKSAQSLWCGFMLKSANHHLFLGGDSGYDTHFKTIGEQYGPFDIAILECGQYNTLWPQIHMQPEETAQAAIDLKAEVLLPVHWAKFTLALHEWNEPVKRLVLAANTLKLKLATPLIGEPIILSNRIPNLDWWSQKS